MKIPFHTCPVPPVPEPCPELPPLSDGLQERLEFFFESGMLPYFKPHALSAVLPTHVRDELIEDGWYVRPDGVITGWQVNARAMDSSQGIQGAVSRTLDEALVYAERELMKLKAMRSR